MRTYRTDTNLSYVEENDKLRAELAVCRETNRRIHEQDTANVAKLQAIRALKPFTDIYSIGDAELLFADDVRDIIDGGGPA